MVHVYRRGGFACLVGKAPTPSSCGCVVSPLPWCRFALTQRARPILRGRWRDSRVDVSHQLLVEGNKSWRGAVP